MFTSFNLYTIEGTNVPKTVSQRRREVAAHLRRELDSGFIVVSAPDHPLVMRSVDVLVGGRTGLTAIVMPTAEEVRHPRIFRARIILNRLALPADAKIIFVGAEMELREHFDYEFSIMAENVDYELKNELVSIAKSARRTISQDAAIEVRSFAERRFSDTYRVARVAQRFGERQQTPSVKPTSRRPLYDKLPGGIEGAFFEGPPSRAAVANLSVDGVERWFHLLHGDPVPTNEPAGLAFVPDYLRVPGDPDKILRACAFAGWVLTPSQSSRSPIEMGELVARYARLR